jgi:hypothetical protein
MTVNEQVPDGWLFMAADFGVDDKYVQLVRDEAQCKLWLRIWDAIDTDGLNANDEVPGLYVRGYGEAFEVALADACEKAMELGVLTDSSVRDFDV